MYICIYIYIYIYIYIHTHIYIKGERWSADVGARKSILSSKEIEYIYMGKQATAHAQD